MGGTGAGSEYCFLCGLPFTDAGLTLPDDDTFDLEWLEYGIGFDPRRRTISMVQSDDGYGRFPIEGTRKWFCSEDRQSPQCEFSGRVCATWIAPSLSKRPSGADSTSKQSCDCIISRSMSNQGTIMVSFTTGMMHSPPRALSFSRRQSPTLDTMAPVCNVEFESA